jgi:hypothetical protein
VLSSRNDDTLVGFILICVKCGLLTIHRRNVRVQPR